MVIMQPNLKALELNIFLKKIKKKKKIIGNKNIVTNIYVIPAYDLIICGYYVSILCEYSSIGFIDFITER